MHKSFLPQFIERLGQFPKQEEQAMAAIKACQRRDLKAWRFQKAGFKILDDDKTNGPNEDLLVAIEFLCPRCWDDETFPNDLWCIYQTDRSDSEGDQVVEAWLRLCEKLPYRWLYAQFHNADASIKSLLPGILAHRNPSYDFNDDALLWLSVQAEIQDAWLAFAQGDFSAKRLPKSLNEAQKQSQTLLSSLAKLVQNQSQWGQDLIKLSPKAAADRDILSQAPELYTICRAEAWRQHGEAARGIEEILNNINALQDNPWLHLQRAKMHIDIDEFAQALHCLEECEKMAEQNTALLESILDEKQRLATQSLRQAMKAPSLIPPLLELTLKYGNRDSFTKAALCYYDAQIDDELLCQALSQNTAGRKAWVIDIARRRDTSRLDDLYRISRAIQAPEDLSTLLLEALTMLDNPKHANDSLEKVLKSPPPMSLNAKQQNEYQGEVSPSALLGAKGPQYAADPLKSPAHPIDNALTKDPYCSPEDIEIYWESAHLWVEINANAQNIDGAIRGVLPCFESQDERRCKLLLRQIIASIPRQALMMLQEWMISSVGLDKTKSLYEGLMQVEELDARIKAQIDAESEQELTPAYLKSAFFLSLPLAWQLAQGISLMTRRDAPTPSLQRIQTQGKAFQTPPTPPVWELRSSEKASDAFEH